MRKPIIAAVNGDCMGGGCEMLQSTDIRIAEEHARFGVPEAKRGLIAGAGSTMRLKRQIPYAVAMEMLLTGRILDAEEALRWGLVTHVVPDRPVAGQGPRDRRGHRRQRAAGGRRRQGVGHRDRLAARGPRPSPIEIGYVVHGDAPKDAKEGMRAFAEKRPAEFKGR